MKTRGHNWHRIDLLAGGRYVGTPCVAVNRRYDGPPSHSAKFNNERDNSSKRLVSPETVLIIPAYSVDIGYYHLQ